MIRSDTDTVAILVALIAFYYFYVKRVKVIVSPLPLPPGPKRLPIIGNLLNMPSTVDSGPTYHRWSKELDTDIIYLNTLGTHIIVLNTYAAAFELLEKRSSIYSSRSRFTMLNELMGWDFAIGFMEYGIQWRQRRRLMHNTFHSAAAALFRPHLLKSSRKLLKRLVDNPDDIMEKIRYMTGETIISITYGLDVQPKDNPYLKVLEHAVEGFSIAAVPRILSS